MFHTLDSLYSFLSVYTIPSIRVVLFLTKFPLRKHSTLLCSPLSQPFDLSKLLSCNRTGLKCYLCKWPDLANQSPSFQMPRGTFSHRCTAAPAAFDNLTRGFPWTLFLCPESSRSCPPCISLVKSAVCYLTILRMRSTRRRTWMVWHWNEYRWWRWRLTDRVLVANLLDQA